MTESTLPQLTTSPAPRGALAMLAHARYVISENPVTGMAFGLLVLIVILQNTEAVETELLFISVSMPRAVLLFGALLIGFALGVLTAGRISRKPKQPT